MIYILNVYILFKRKNFFQCYMNHKEINTKPYVETEYFTWIIDVRNQSQDICDYGRNFASQISTEYWFPIHLAKKV